MSSDRAAAGRWLRDIDFHIELAQKFTENLTHDLFCADLRAVYAVTRCLEIISEASRRLPEDIKTRHPMIAWKEMAGAGNVYRHDYEGLDPSQIWVTICDHLPPLRRVVEREIAALEA